MGCSEPKKKFVKFNISDEGELNNTQMDLNLTSVRTINLQFNRD